MTDPWTVRLSEYIDGTLPAEERSALDRHLPDCPECQDIVADLKDLVAEAGTMADRSPALDLWSGVASRIRRAPRIPALEARARGGRLVTLPVPWLVAAGLALAVLSGSASWWLLRSTAGAAATPVTATGPDSSGSEGGIPVGTTRLATDTYHQAVMELRVVLEAGEGRLDTATVRVLEQNLAIIDRALAQARTAIEADPANRYLREHLQQTLQRKLDVMRRAADLVQASS